MKHLYALPFFIALCFISNAAGAQPASGYLLETLDQPYVPLTEGVVLGSENWDAFMGWDDPEFLVPIGFDFDFGGTVISNMVQVEEGATFAASEFAYDYGSNTAMFGLFGQIDIVDLALTGIDSLNASTIRWHTSGDPGQQVFTLDFANAGLFDEVFSDATETFSSMSLQFRLFESTGVLEIHYGPSSLSDAGFGILQNNPFSGWHALFPTVDSYYDGGSFILTNLNTELMYTDNGSVFQGIPFVGFPEEGRLFRYTPVMAGCDIQTACNYDPLVNYAVPEDCIFPDTPGTDCNGVCLNDVNEDGTCDDILGCTLGMACNYNPEATENDGSCNVPDTGYGCDGTCLSDVDGDAVCDANEIAGCEDPIACNYVENPTDLVPCDYAETFYNCDGECLNDTDGDGVCDELEQPGCTDEDACNYQWSATDDDGSCVDALPLTLSLVGDTTIAVGELIVVNVDGPVGNFYGYISFSNPEGAAVLQSSNVVFVGVVLEESGSIEFWYEDYFGCTSDTLTVAWNTNTSSVLEQEGSLSFYPNPVSSSLTVDVPQIWAAGVDARMVNALGQTVWSQRLFHGTHVLDVSDLPNGMHLLMYEDRAHRVVIQH